uniref:Ig-like domain-containing protein n=1 Tax=Erpetoichthys calabaricus TaxID=27687 RepID=A0A8C4SRX6_ERPCA
MSQEDIIKMCLRTHSFVPFPDVSLADVFMQPHRSVRAQLGGSVHLECHMKVSSQYSYIWIKHTQGELPETIVFWSYHEGRTHKANDGSTRYQVMTSLSSFNLSITHLDTSDLGTYYCGVVKPYDILGIFQPPVLKPVQYGDDVTLECIINRRVFGNAHQVFWIHRTIGGSYQTIRSTHENQRKCAGESQECVHSLQKKNFSFQDAGTYYCALVSCGEIILGNGTESADWLSCFFFKLNLIFQSTKMLKQKFSCKLSKIGGLVFVGSFI